MNQSTNRSNEPININHQKWLRSNHKSTIKLVVNQLDEPINHQKNQPININQPPEVTEVPTNQPLTNVAPSLCQVHSLAARPGVAFRAARQGEGCEAEQRS